MPWYDDEWPRKRRIPADGIRAKTQRGDFGATWWAKRWIGVLEGFGWGNRMQRGRSYARNGSVLNLDLTVGKISAKVQGSNPKPYQVTIGIKPLSDAQWEQVIDAMAGQAIFAAKLLSGEMPQDIEEAFNAAGVPLFPKTSNDITTKCSCPDVANPCKHIAAVYYLLGERFDEDPFLLFELRGRGQEQIIDALRARRATIAVVADEPAEQYPVAPALDASLATFYSSGDLTQIEARIAAPPLDAPLLRQFGPAPAADDELRALYRAMTDVIMRRMFGADRAE